MNPDVFAQKVFRAFQIDTCEIKFADVNILSIGKAIAPWVVDRVLKKR